MNLTSRSLPVSLSLLSVSKSCSKRILSRYPGISAWSSSRVSLLSLCSDISMTSALPCENLCLSAEEEYDVFSGMSRLTILGYDPSVRSTADVPRPMTSLSIPAVGSESFMTRYGLYEYPTPAAQGI